MMMMITHWIVHLYSDQEFLDSFCVLMTLGITWETQMYNNNNNVHLLCADQRPERSHDIY